MNGNKQQVLKRCSICGGPYTDHGHNAAPAFKGMCCTDCHVLVVLPARLEQLRTATTKLHSKMTGMTWELLHPRMTAEWLGYLPGFLRLDDPRSAKEQIHERYISGWHPFQGAMTLRPDDKLKYPGDPLITPLARSQLRDERIVLYEHDWVAIIQPDRSFEVARLD